VEHDHRANEYAPTAKLATVSRSAEWALRNHHDDTPKRLQFATTYATRQSGDRQLRPQELEVVSPPCTTASPPLLAARFVSAYSELLQHRTLWKRRMAMIAR